MQFIALGLLSLFSVVVSAVFLLVPMLQGEQEDSAVTAVQELVVILAASTNLAQGKVLRSEDIVEVGTLPTSVPSGYFVPGEASLSQMVGKVARVPIPQGLPLTADLLAEPNYAGHLAAGVTEGMRAISILVDDASGVSGLVQPRDRVDVVLTSNAESETSTAVRSKISETILRNAKVVAVGARLEPSEAVPTAPEARLRTATLEVTPKDAERLILAQQIGTLSLLLIPLGTEQTNNAVVIEAAETGTTAVEVSGEFARRAAIESPTLTVDVVRGRQPTNVMKE